MGKREDEPKLPGHICTVGDNLRIYFREHGYRVQAWNEELEEWVIQSHKFDEWQDARNYAFNQVTAFADHWVDSMPTTDQRGKPHMKKDVRHMFDSSQTCNYCGVAEEQTERGEKCPKR